MEIQMNQKAIDKWLKRHNDIFYSVWAKFKVDNNEVPFFSIGNNGDKWFALKEDDLIGVSRDDVQKFYDELGKLLSRENN